MRQLPAAVISDFLYSAQAYFYLSVHCFLASSSMWTFAAAEYGCLHWRLILDILGATKQSTALWIVWYFGMYMHLSFFPLMPVKTIEQNAFELSLLTGVALVILVSPNVLIDRSRVTSFRHWPVGRPTGPYCGVLLLTKHDCRSLIHDCHSRIARKMECIKIAYWALGARLSKES